MGINLQMKKSYFLISISNRNNLHLCTKYNLAGFTNSISGVWTFVEVQEGDLISFLYGAKAHNLYSVRRKEAIKEAESVPPWQPITFQQSGRTYYFPFRLYLQPVRKFEESLVRTEFAYVAENLLLRGGYRRTHFQADQTTLQTVSQMGVLWNGCVSPLTLPSYSTFLPRFTWERESVSIPEIFQFQELILQSLIRQHLRNERNLSEFLQMIEINNIPPQDLEILGEKAFPEGHIDILIKEAIPIGISRKVIIEVKTNAVNESDLTQLRSYAQEIKEECIAAVLIARKFSPAMVKKSKEEQIKSITYTFDQLDLLNGIYTFEGLLKSLRLERAA
ncbi:hypothetical protein M1N83_02240 [Dehalococcoidia bacterium]|nr:hypothetical protein [Dehalococcoidia bacterium]